MVQAAVIRVMVVDDQASMRAVIRHSLQDLGIKQVRDSGSAAAALESIRDDRVHLIVSDYNMPDMDGLELLKAVREDDTLRRTAFIMLTGSANRDVVQQAAALGVNDYLVKPFATAALKEKIERVFGELS